jgi:magnesium-transporting ATPase (P-type)
MEDKIDKITKEILSYSHLELSDPLFNNTVMKQIAIESHRKLKHKLFLLFLFIGSIIALSGLLVIRIFHIDLFYFFLNPGKFSEPFYLTIRSILGNIPESEYLILPIALLFVIGKLINEKLTYNSVKSI